MHKHKLERVVVINDAFELRGLMTVKDITKQTSFPNAARDSHGGLRVGAAVGFGDDTEQRVELLRGLLMAKPGQYKQERDVFLMKSTNWNEIRTLQSLVESIGCKTTLNEREFFKSYFLEFKCRRQLLSFQTSPPVKVHSSRRFIKEINKISGRMCVHIETEGQDGTFLVGEGFIACR
jgi:hypothetical protein